MNKYIGGIFLIVVVIAVFVWISGGGAEDEATTTPESVAQTEAMQTESMENESEAGNTTAFRELIAAGVEQRCEFSSVEEGMETSGTAFIAGDRFAVEAMYIDETGTYDSGMIYTDETSYAWSEQADGTYGVMFAVPKEEFLTDSSVRRDAAQPGVDLSQRVKYDCKSWSVDEARFTPPADIEFVDMAAMMEMNLENLEM